MVTDTCLSIFPLSPHSQTHNHFRCLGLTSVSLTPVYESSGFRPSDWWGKCEPGIRMWKQFPHWAGPQCANAKEEKRIQGLRALKAWMKSKQLSEYLKGIIYWSINKGLSVEGGDDGSRAGWDGGQRQATRFSIISLFLLGKGRGQSSPMMAASCLVMTKLSNGSGEDAVSPTELFVSAGTLMQQFADESSWEKTPIPYSLLLLDPSHIKSQNSVES